MIIFILCINGYYNNQNSIYKLLMNKTSEADYFLVITVIATLLLGAYSAKANYGVGPINNYITVTTVKLDLDSFFTVTLLEMKNTYEYVLPSVKADTNYQAVVIPQISLSYKDAKTLGFLARALSKSQTSVIAQISVKYPMYYTLFSINILVIDAEFKDAIFIQFDTYTFGNVSYLAITKTNTQTYATATTKVFSSLVGCNITVSTSLKFGFYYSASVENGCCVNISFVSPMMEKYNLEYLSYVNIFIDSAKLLLVSPEATVTFGKFSDATGTNSNLKVVDTSNKMRSYNTIIGLTSLIIIDGKFDFKWIVTPSEKIEASSQSGWEKLQFNYMVFEFEGCLEGFIGNSYNECVCPQENSVVIEGKCFPCGNILQYSNRTVFNESTCNCNDTFIFNSAAKTCDCPLPNSVVIGGKCFPCANISLYSNGTAFNTSTCNCNETFVFNSTNKTCFCPQENSVVIEGKCFPCGNILQYSNRTVFNESTCNCNDTFIFNSAAKTCDCPLPNSVVNGGKCFPCANISLYSNGTAFNTSTCNCNETFVFNSTNKTCFCPQENSVVIEGKCFPCGNILQYSNRTVFNESTCNCNDTFIFNSAAKTCDCPLPNSVVIGGKCFPCANISLYSNGTAFNTSTCNCNETFVFNSTNKTCFCPQENSVVIEGKCFPCGNILQYSNRTVFNESTCNCNDTFIFNSAAKTCDCPLPNSVVIGGKCFPCANISLYSNGTAFNTSTCNCNETFVFNSTNKTCFCPQENSVVIEGKCFPCGNILQYSNRTVFNESTCNCNDTFIFNSAAKTCDCPLPNSVVIGGKCFPCANISLYSNGTASICNCNETFVFNSTTKACVCPYENSVIIQGKCFSCLILINFYSSGFINSSQPNSCECNATFAFNKTAKACQCPFNSVILDGKCFLCTDLKDKNSSGLINLTSDSPACQCFPTFVFNTTSKSCECPDSNSYISLDGRCVSCSGVGPVDQANRTCICAPNYIYNRTTNKCFCLVSKLFSLNTCFSCSSIRYLNSTGLVDPKDSSLCQCYHSFVFYTQTNVCQCPDPLSYVSITRVCVSCRDIGNNTNGVNGTNCVCSPTYVYDAKLNKCLCPPASIIINNLCFLCSTLKGNNCSGLVSPTNPKQCQCTFTFTFNSETKQCGCPNDVNYFVSKQNKCVSCLNIENGNGKALISSKVCQCNETYIYSAIENKCICPARSIVLSNGECFSCQTLKSKNSSGLVNTVTKNTCQCFKTFFFNPANKACECSQGQFVSKRGKCFSCAGAEGTGEFNQTSKECICNETYIYSSSLNKCICPPTSVVINSQCFVCSTLKGKNGTGEISKTSSSACQCLKSFVFTEEKTCECPNAANSFVSKGGLCVSCLGIANGFNDEADLTSKKCVCKQSFVYNQRANLCQCPLSSVIIDGLCFQCSTLKNKNSTGAVSNTDPSSCSCLTSFLFDPTSKTCLCPNDANSFVSSAGRCVSCIGILNGQNDLANITAKTCVCKNSFVYVASANKCECPQSSIVINGECFSCSTLTNKNSTGGINATTGNTCRCLRSYVFNSKTKACECPDEANSYISPTKQCVSCIGVQNGTGTATKNGCECKDNTFVFYPSSRKCLCPPKYSFIGDSCTLSAHSQAAKEVVCPRNLQWDIFLQKCICKLGYALKGNECIKCKSIANAIGDASDKLSCICEEGFTWDSAEYSCK